MSIKTLCDFCDRPLEKNERGYITYSTKRLNTRKMFPSLCKSCADKLDTVIELAEDTTRKRCQDFGHWTRINKARREQLGTKG